MAGREGERPTGPTVPASGIYYLHQPLNGLVKIGMATDIRARWAQIETAGGCLLELVAVEPGGRKEEAARHAQFARLRVRGEWFVRGPDLEEHLAALGEPRFQEKPRLTAEAVPVAAAAAPAKPAPAAPPAGMVSVRQMVCEGANGAWHDAGVVYVSAAEAMGRREAWRKLWDWLLAEDEETNE